jgi:small subunit ribosomal protein S15
MALTQQRKQEIMGDFQTHETDTGSADVQVAMLTDRITKLSAHLKINQKDFASRRGLMMMISRRKRLLAYIQRENADRYKALIARLGIRG